YLERLTHLNLANCQEWGSARSLAVLCNSPVFKRLRWLDLRNLRMGFDLSALLVALTNSQLRWFDLNGNGVPLHILREVADWRNALRGRGAQAFMNSIGMDFTLVPSGSFLMGSPESEAQRYEDE